MLRSNHEIRAQPANRHAQQRTHLKENMGGDGRPHGRGVLRTQGSQMDTTAQNLSSRLASIRGKQEYQRKADPLNDSKLLNRYTAAPASKFDLKRDSSTNLQRSFSFVNRDSDDEKHKTQVIKSNAQQNSQFLRTQQVNRFEVRKNSSFGIPSQDAKFKYQPNKETASKYQQIQVRVASDYKKDLPRSNFTPKMTELRGQEGHALPDDQRIQSIDKINVKIKEILRSLNDSAEKDQQEVINPMLRQTTDKKAQILLQRLSVTDASLLDSSWQAKSPSTQNACTRSGIHHYNKRTLKTEQSVRICTQPSQQQAKFPPSRDFDFEIRKIEEKIKKSEEQKIKLNIRFEESQSLNRTESASKAVIAKNCARGKEMDAERTLKAAVIKTQHPSQEPVLRSQLARETQFAALRYSVRPPKVCQQEESIPKAQPFNFKLIPVKCDPEHETASHRESSRVIETLKEQVRLDEELRNAKVWLDSVPGLEDKWDQLQNLLRKNNLDMDTQKIKAQFQSSLDEHNPFYTARDATGESISTVVSKYFRARQHWHNKVLGRFDCNQLQKENFTEERVDLQRKGHLTIEDFVRFLNMETGTFYRNRDLVLIFRRLSPSDKLCFSDMIRMMTRQS